MESMVEGFHTPVLLNVFNRPEETAMVLTALKRIEPPVLYVHCDGPRAGNEGDTSNVQKVQSLIEETVTWDCELKKKYERSNLGCGKGPAASMSWFFSNVEEGIILEDDCCPHPDFFMYCQELLERYRDDERVAIISGTNFERNVDERFSYRFSAYAGIWGWATWRRTWIFFDFDFSKSDKDFRKRVLPFTESRQAVRYWLGILHRCIADGHNRTYWDYQLHLGLLYANKIHILPNTNLVTNIGFNEKATHTRNGNSSYANKAAAGILPLRHPAETAIDHVSDNRPYEIPFEKRLKRFVKRLIRR